LEKSFVTKEGEIPQVFKSGVLKQLSGSSLSRLMSEIENYRTTEHDVPLDERFRHIEGDSLDS